MENRISPGSNREFLPTDLFLCHSPHAPDKKLRGSMAGDVKDLLKCCSALITLTVVMNQLLLVMRISKHLHEQFKSSLDESIACLRVLSPSQPIVKE